MTTFLFVIFLIIRLKSLVSTVESIPADRFSTAHEPFSTWVSQDRDWSYCSLPILITLFKTNTRSSPESFQTRGAWPRQKQKHTAFSVLILSRYQGHNDAKG